MLDRETTCTGAFRRLLYRSVQPQPSANKLLFIVLHVMTSDSGMNAPVPTSPLTTLDPSVNIAVEL